jgi:hypothetical protein
VPFGAARMRRVLAVASCGVLSVALSACESTEQESARISREGQRLVASQGPLKLGAVSHSVRVSEVTLLSGGGRMAVAVRLSDTSTRPQKDVPLVVEVEGTGGKRLYSNETGGLDASLQHIALLQPRQEEYWVDDQILTSQSATTARVRAGSAPEVRSSSIPQLTATAGPISRQAGLSVLAGGLVNHSATSMEKVPVFAVALRAGRIVAAGRAVVESLPAHSARVPFQIFLVGNPAGATIKLTAAPTVA